MSTLITKTRQLLMDDPRSIAIISIGCQIPYHWIVNFKYGKSSSPSAEKVEQLYVFLAGKPLFVE